MLNAETKRHIDAARDVLVGVAPNPMTQIDQITYALIYKFMDDMDQAAIKAGGDPSFFTGDLEPYAWSRLVDSRIGNQEKMNLYGEALQKFAEAKQLPELFRTIFRSAFLPYRSPETLGLFLKEINFFDYTHPEELGNAYEYLLSIMSAQGDAGQFRTPRHIIDFIVDVINPTKDDTVLDPACGTGGFLVSSYNHILEQHQGKSGSSKQEKPLTPDERKKLMNNLEGYDIDPSMVRIAQVNMYLHQFKNPRIFQYDSLTSEERWSDKFDVILANPPFMSPKGGIKPHSKFALQSNRSEVLFVDYIVNHLKPGGRAGIIVPEGIIFQSGKAYKQLRKELVEGGLYAVVSLPSGVFYPYSGVKTSILFINNEIAKTRDEILFVKISADGYDLGSTRRLSDKNDLPEAITELRLWGQKRIVTSPICTPISKSVIASNEDFNLNFDSYRTSGPRESIWGLVSIGEVAEVISGQSPEGKFYNQNGEGTPFYQGKTEFTDKFLGAPTKWTTSVTKIADPGDILISVRAPVGPVNIATQKICIGRGLAAIRPSGVNRDFLFYVLKFLEDKISGNGGSVFDSINRKQIEGLEVPLPPLNVQEQIVSELDCYSEIIEGAKKIVGNWRPRIDVDPEWKMARLGDLVEVLDSKRKPITKSERVAGPYPYYGATGIVDYVAEYIFDEPLVLVGEDGAKWNSGDSTAFLVEGKCWVNNHAHVIRPDRSKLLDLYLASYLTQLDLSPFITGVTVPKLNQDKLKSIEIPLPPLEVQILIASQLMTEIDAVEAAKRLLESAESRTSKIIDALWRGMPD
jgi:type I restriction enzyme M protein